MLVSIVLSFSIDTRFMRIATGPGVAPWLPPVWFLGLHQFLPGDPDAAMAVLAHRAQWGLAIAAALAVATYAVSYQRHRKLLVEGSRGSARGDRKWTGRLLEGIVPNPRQRAILVFLSKTLVRSSQHRMLLMGYGGFGLAILLTFLLIGLRHLFTIPVELKANWTFQITERQGRVEWMRAVDRFLLFWGAVWMLAVPFPLEAMLLGWRAVAEAVLFAAFGLVCYEWVFTDWQKLPFTCSHLPGKIPAWILTLYGIGILGALPIVNGLLLVSLFHPIVYSVLLALLVTIWLGIYSARRIGFGELRLVYDDVPDPAIHGLNLLR